MEVKMAKIQFNQKQFTLTIPKEYIEQAGLKKGDIVTVSFNERGNLEIKKLK
jgi:bifunctional DNA-binding transcriptional regulator/antitoxin component of YhaV-PrlF toxin-antitoxin module